MIRNELHPTPEYRDSDDLVTRVAVTFLFLFMVATAVVGPDLRGAGALAQKLPQIPSHGPTVPSALAESPIVAPDRV